ncbi:hypothetical protein [Pedobacter cryoconitis]|uniref:hypothetical protein n=1 Tax=Pedobacter cryoconitis TaxID=188932 RepID=UPI0016170BC3|nr:hypothetical protein [Pedobacter cryoconitis]MBB5644890.1 endonuclease III-like uncharacterized protein [Pedobacter cryoconitis]
MKIVLEARKLANYINNLKSFETFYVETGFCYNHIGALFVDITLQAGLNYNTVVKPRVQHILLKYSEADTTYKFQNLIDNHSLENIIKWKNHIKIDRLKRLVDFAFENNINTCLDFKIFLLNVKNQEKLLKLNGIGPKTIDYTLKLLNFDTVAVDRHIYSFVEMAEITTTGYHSTKKIVEYAADFLKIPRSTMDYSIWKFMSSKENGHYKDILQMELDFK